LSHLVFGLGFFAAEISDTVLPLSGDGETTTAKQLRIARFVGYMGVFFGCLLLIEIAFGWVH
jgi:hypothetical protein